MALGSDTNQDLDPWAGVRKEIEQRMALLPEDVRNIILSDNYNESLFAISKEHKLTYEQMSGLEIETTMVLLGMTKPDEYRDLLQAEIKKNDPEVDSIVAAVNDRIFAPVRVSLEKIYLGKKEAEDYLEEAPNEQKILEAEELSDTERSVLTQTGVVVNESKPVIQVGSSSPLPARTDILNAIENPPKSSGPGIIASKLAGSDQTLTPTKTTDYSLPKTSSSNTSTPPPSSDPYREPVN